MVIPFTIICRGMDLNNNKTDNNTDLKTPAKDTDSDTDMAYQ